MIRLRHLVVACSALLLITATGQAAFYVETGDAGSLPNSAQAVTGVSVLDGISGNLSSTTDRDVFAIYLVGGRTFSATTVGQPGTLADTQLFLFDANGRGVYGNDDDANGEGINSLRSTLPAGTAMTPLNSGIYYLMIVASGANPVSAGGLIFPNYASSPAVDSTAVVGPTGPGGGSPVTGFSTATSAAEFGTYRILLTGAGAVPEPSSLLLVGSAATVLAVGGWVRRRYRVA